MKRRIAIVGSTGSVGCSAINIIKLNKGLFEVDFLVASSNYKILIQQAIEVGAKYVALDDESVYKDANEYLKKKTPIRTIQLLSGKKEILNLIKNSTYDTILISSLGAQSINYIYCAIGANKTIALANKESIVCAGYLMQKKLKQHNSKIIPVDSEHSSLFQILEDKDISGVSKLYLTGSGGPFLDFSLKDLKLVTKEQALRHPTWNMGAKISIDSATFMNKALEFIEASYLFNVHASNIDVLIHRKSIMHGAVSFNDGSFIAHMSYPSMELPVAYALHYPNRLNTSIKPLNLAEIGILEFEELDSKRFKSINLAKQAILRGGNSTCILNAVNEVAVEAFLEGRINFIKIVDMVEYFLNKVQYKLLNSIEEVMQEHNELISQAKEHINKH